MKFCGGVDSESMTNFLKPENITLNKLSLLGMLDNHRQKQAGL